VRLTKKQAAKQKLAIGKWGGLTIGCLARVDLWERKSEACTYDPFVSYHSRIGSATRAFGDPSLLASTFYDHIIQNGWLSLNLLDFAIPLRKRAFSALIPVKPA
jgi:hypothetical protein